MTPIVSTPSPPDPAKTAAAQAQYNQQTAATTQAMNMVDQYNPWGSVVYDQTGSQQVIGADGKPIDVPKYSQTTTYTPEQQAIFDKSQQAQTNLADIAADQSAKVGDILNDPFQFNNDDASNWAYDLASQRILPQQQQNEAALRSQLINSGIRPGTSAWDSEMSRLTNANTDQLNQLALNGRSQAFNEALTTRNQPLNEIIGLMSGTQLQNPGTASSATPQTGVGGVDYTGLVNQQYQAQLAQSQAGMGGLFGLLGAGISALPFSDRRLKTDIRRVGHTDDGVPIYAYRYVWGGPIQIGVMAQDVPQARVKDPSGFYRVDYERVH